LSSRGEGRGPAEGKKSIHIAKSAASRIVRTRGPENTPRAKLSTQEVTQKLKNAHLTRLDRQYKLDGGTNPNLKFAVGKDPKGAARERKKLRTWTQALWSNQKSREEKNGHIATISSSCPAQGIGPCIEVMHCVV